MQIEENILSYIIMVFAGIIAGFVNTLSGNGSFITISVLMLAGLPPNIANGTNRVGVLVQSMVGTLRYKKSGALNLSGNKLIFFSTFLGSVIGALIAVDISEAAMNYSIVVCMFAILFWVIYGKKQWLKSSSTSLQNRNNFMEFIVFFAIGIYGGFLQAGVGILLLSAMIMKCGLSLLNANGIKLLLTLFLTIPALAIFIYNNQIYWLYGALLAGGQAFGSWFAANLSLTGKIELYMHSLTVLMICAAIIKLLVI